MLRVSEFYPSFQGEGPNTGRPTVFIRFAGCNLKCPGWPCDSQHAIDPKIFTKEQVAYTPNDLATDAAKLGPSNFCLTGGEVFLQSIEDLESLIFNLQQLHTADGGPTTVEVFTNGTRWIPDKIRAKLSTIILDWKLPGSGEDLGKASGPGLTLLDPKNWLTENLQKLRPYDAIKFTVKDKADFFEAKKRYTFLTSSLHFGGVVYCGPVWDAIDAAELAGWILEHRLPWNLNIQTHKYIWHPDARRT